jgi:hypothetical protein
MIIEVVVDKEELTEGDPKAKIHVDEVKVTDHSRAVIPVSIIMIPLISLEVL